MRRQFVQIASSILACAVLAAPSPAQTATSTVSGVVRDRHGAPQIDVLVELLRSDSSVVAAARTDSDGAFLLGDLLPGVYQIKATEEAFLPTLERNLHLAPHRRTVADLTLSTLLDVVQWLPAERRAAGEPGDDWKWTLRSETNRPVLRFSDDGPMLVFDGSMQAGSRARVITTGGLRSFGDGGFRHGMEYEATGHGSRTLLRTSLNAADGLQSAYMAAYEREMAPGRTFRSVAAFTDMPDLTGGAYGGGHYQAATLRTAETADVSPWLRAEIGNELLAMRLMGVEGGTQAVSQPFGSLTIHAGGTALSYRFASSPLAQDASAMADEETLLPPVAQRDGVATLERGLHQELRLAHSGDGGMRWYTAVYHDSLEHPLVQGSGAVRDADLAGGNLLLDPVSGVFRASAGGYSGYGVSAGGMVPLSQALALSADVAAGQALASPAPAVPGSVSPGSVSPGSVSPGSASGSFAATGAMPIDRMLAALRAQMTPAVAVGAEGRVPHAATYWRASYRWQPAGRVTAVNPYGVPAGDAYLSLLLRQPIRVGRVLPGGMQAVIDMRNLLAQGYCPFITPDGSTLFFAQADRSIAGGVAFTF